VKKSFLTPKSAAFCGAFGAAALLLPIIFHALHLGSLFLPMYLPLVALAFFVPPAPAALTAFIVPLLSGAATGMPPVYPPVAPMMSIELSLMGLIIAFALKLKPSINPYVILVPTLLLGRVIGVAMSYAAASIISLPPKYVAGISFFGAWPGLILMIAVVPPLALFARRTTAQRPEGEP